MDRQADHYRLVLADDHVLIRHGIKLLLAADQGLEVVGEAGNGDELLAVLQGREVDLLILDISMPGVNGIELTEVLKKSYPTLKILVLTMHRSLRFLRRALGAGANGYLNKSDTEQEILAAIGKIREGYTYISPCLEDEFAEDLLQTCRQPVVARTFKGLTAREKQVLGLVVTGLTSKQTAARLGLSPRTVEHHRASLLRKFDLNNSVDLVNLAIRHGYVSIE